MTFFYVNWKILQHIIFLSPNSCIFEFQHIKMHKFPSPFFRHETMCWSTRLSTVKALHVVDKKRQQATQAPSKTDENLNHFVSTTCRPRVSNSPFQGLSEYTPHAPTSGTLSGHK